MPALIASILTWLATKIGAKALMVAIQAVYLALVFAIYSFLITWVIQTYNLVSAVIDYLNSGGGISDSQILNKFWGLLNCVGFVDAFNASKPMLFSALTALLLALLYRPTKKVYSVVVESAYKAISA